MPERSDKKEEHYEDGRHCSMGTIRPQTKRQFTSPGLETGLTYYEHNHRISLGSQTVGNDFLQASIYCHIAMVHVPSASMELRGVGHLMGKKSTDEFRSLGVSEGDGLKEQLREYIRWEEAASNLLGVLEALGNRSHQPPQHQPTWDSEDGSYSSDVQHAKLVDSLLQVLKGKEGTYS
ncbi:gastrin-releasing peptide isoform X1 [Cricetulus griseus]|uniref:gastrin-releasing peptide isoform X1 n=1 Tax=Cricetulus griseus TaxID=10029 RepID=UPI000454A279|nr:gastrin-releasing peptide isoform X1 [Cricetulus griseus]